MKKICVYAASRLGNDETYARASEELGKGLIKNKIDLVYGGSTGGLMGTIADTVLKLGGKVYGIMPKDLFTEVQHKGITEFHEVENMHDRKAMMLNLSDGFIALPGGFGTLEELFEVISWANINLIHKPIGILNVNDFYQPLIEMVNHTIENGFISPEARALIIVETDPYVLINRMKEAWSKTAN